MCSVLQPEKDEAENVYNCAEMFFTEVENLTNYDLLWLWVEKLLKGLFILQISPF